MASIVVRPGHAVAARMLADLAGELAAPAEIVIHGGAGAA
jgi:hypothetical protein